MGQTRLHLQQAHLIRGWITPAPAEIVLTSGV